MEVIGDLTSGPLLESGIYPGLEADAAPLWVDGENVIFDNGGVRKAYGLLGLETLAARPTGMKATVAATEPRLFIGAGTSAYRYRSSDGLTTIGGFATSGGIYQFVPWDTWVLISNGSDPVELWQNAGSSAPITAPFTRANTLFGYQSQAFAGGTNNGGQYVEWSPVNAVTDWTVTSTGTAGFTRCRGLIGDIVAAQPIGNSIAIYGYANAGIFTYVGGVDQYKFRNPMGGIGAISPYSVVQVGNRHYGLTRDNVFVTDLVGYELIDEPAIRSYLAENANWSRLTEVYGWHDWAHSMVRWVVPTGVSDFISLGFRYDKRTWTKFNDSVICGESSGPFANMFLGKSSRLLRLDKSSVNNDGSAYSSFIQTKPLDCGDRRRYKRFEKISLDMTWSGTVSVKIAFTDHVNTTPSFNLTYSAANEIYFDQPSVQSEAAYIHIKIITTAADATWRLSGAKLYGDYTGYVN